MERGLSKLHLLLDTIFYPAQNTRSLLSTPQIRPYAEGAAPKLPIKAEEAWLYRHLPLLLLEDRPGGGYRVDPRSAMNVLHSLRFTAEGRVVYLHPALMIQLGKYFLAARLGRSDIKTGDMIKSTVFTGDKRLRSVPVMDPIIGRLDRLTTATMDPCKARRCTTPEEAVHPRSEFIMGAAMCNSCIQKAFKGDATNWISLTEARRSFAPAMLEATLNKWLDKPLRFVLTGMALDGVAPLENRKPVTLEDYEWLGRDFLECPVDRTLERWPMEKTTIRQLLELCDPLAWRQLLSFWKSTRAMHSKMIGRTLLDENFRFFGWTVIEVGCKSFHSCVIGPTLTSIDDADNSPEDYALREIRIGPDENHVRRVLMRGSVYTVWRRLLHGYRLQITATSLDYAPNHHTVAVDASQPLHYAVIKSATTDLAIYHAEHLTYGALARVMAAVPSAVAVHLYGSVAASVAGKVDDRPLREGLLADLVFTFRYFELNDLQSSKDSVINVRISPVGPELIPLCVVADRKTMEQLDMEKAMLANRLPVPVFPQQIEQHPAWKQRLRMPILLQQLNHVLMRGVKLPLVYIQRLMPVMKRRKVQKNSLVTI